MRAVVKVKQSQGRGPSNAARYIAESKIDPKREGKGLRPLFTNRGDDDLKYGAANRYLKDGRGRPAKGDLIHFLASFYNEDFVPLGATDEERKERLREAAREAMEELKSDLRIADWRWVAAIHLNTKNPHIHFLIYKETKDDKGERLRLGKIPKRLLPRSDQSSDGRTIPVEGDMSRYFVEALDRELDRVREAGRERQESPTRMAIGGLEAGVGINKESSPPSPKPLAKPSLRDSSAGQLSAIRVVNRKHFKGSGGENEVYIGRATTGVKGSVLGNPYRIGRDGAREEVIEKYGRWLSWEIAERGDAYRELQRLAEIARTGELVFVCWCTPEKCHGEAIRSEIESINDLRNREPEAPDMSEILSHSLEFDTPLIHQGIEYRTVENFYQAMKTAKDDLETRRKIAAATPDEIRRLGAQIQARPDWPEIRREVLETALRHKFAPGTRWHARLRSTGDREITDGSKDNVLGHLLMDIREESKRGRPETFLDRLSGETRSWLTLEVMPAIDRLLEAGKTRQEIFTEIDRQVYRRRLPSGARERSKEIAERARINDFLKARADLRLYSDDRLLELAEKNPSPAGRELTRELILRGPHQKFGAEPDVRSDLREAFRDRHLSETGYETQHGKAGWLGRHSSELRDMHERGAVIKDDILIIPAEPHELNGVVNDRKPFMNELRYAFELIRDPARAVEFHTLGKAIAGRTADAKAEIEFFKYYCGLLSREKGDEQGRPLRKGEIEAREEALEIVLGKMRELAPAMEEQESRVSVEVQRPGFVDSLEEIRDAQASALYDDEQEHMPETADVQAIEESDPDLDEPEVTEREPEAGRFIFNTAARTVNLNDESLRLPGGLTFEDRKELVGVHMPNIDAKLENGTAPKTILSGIDELVEERNRNLSDDLTNKQRERALAKNQSAGAFLKDYVAERLKDPETRALNRSEAFREAHARITEARTPDELNRAADAARNDNRFNERDRKLLFFGRAPDHTQEMRELRRMWWLPQKERVKTLSEGRLAPSPELKELVAELDSRDSKGRVDYFFSALKNPPEKMRKSEESVRLGIWPKFQSLLSHERAYLLDLTWEKKQSFAGRHPSLRETARRLEEAPGGSLRTYTAAVAEIERRLLDEATSQKLPAGKVVQEIAPADGLLDREEKLRIRAIAAGLAWERIEPREISTNDPAVIELLSLSDAVARLRDEAQLRAREAAGKLDEFIRSRDLDRFAAEKTDYYYCADQISKDELEKLSPADKLEFAALERQAGMTFREFKEGFGAIDKIRNEIDRARNGAGRAAPPGGAQAKEDKGQHIDRAVGQGNRVETSAPTTERERMNDRIILGNAIIAHARADSAALDYEIARDHGRTFRFNIRDESVEANRRISDLDIHRRAGARGDRVADERGAERKEDRVAIRGQVSEADVRHHSTTLEEHGKKLGGLVKEIETRAKNALEAYQHARRLAEGVVEKYQKRGETPPAPFVGRDTLVRTQDEAVERRLAGHADRFERLRVALAEEHGQPLRDDREAARLAAQVFTARTELQAREERAARFDETRHLRQWEIRGEKLSLAGLDRLIEQATDKAQVVGNREFHIFPGDRRQASAEVERLGGVRQEVVEKIGEQQNDLRKSVSEAGKLLDTLTRAYEREAVLREQAGLVMPDPQFTRQELERSADNIETARDAAALRQLSVFERQFNSYADPKERLNPAEGWGRAPARALVAEIFHRESSERLTAFRERGSLQPLLIETSGGLVTHRFKDTEPRTLIELLASPIVETPSQREIRHAAQAAFAQYETRLRADVEKTRAYLEAAREITSSQAAERSLRAGRELPAPDEVLTPKQAMIVEIHAERQTDLEERERLLGLARGSALSQHDSHSRTNSPDRAAAREVTFVIGRGR